MTDRRQRKRQQILDGAIEVLRRLPGGSMGEIADGLGVSRATLYRFFTSRDELIREVALESLRVTDAAAARLPLNLSSYEATFAALFELLIPVGDRYHFLLNEPRAMRDPGVAAGVAQQSASMRAFIEQAKAAGELPKETPSAWIATLFDSALWSAWHSVSEGDIARNDAAALAMRAFWRGVAP